MGRKSWRRLWRLCRKFKSVTFQRGLGKARWLHGVAACERQAEHKAWSGVGICNRCQPVMWADQMVEKAKGKLNGLPVEPNTVSEDQKFPKGICKHQLVCRMVLSASHPLCLPTKPSVKCTWFILMLECFRMVECEHMLSPPLRLKCGRINVPQRAQHLGHILRTHLRFVN